MNRRRFILAAAAVGTVIAVPFVYKKFENAKWKKEPLKHPLVLSYFCDEATIRKLGHSYGAIAPTENSKSKLTELLVNELKIADPGLTEHSVTDSALETKVEQDFKTQKVLILNGWMVSQTEARQCALLSLS